MFVFFSTGSSSDFAVFISKPIPGISVTHLSFVQNSRTIARTLLDSCSEIGALVGNATFPLGLVIYQLQGRGAEDKQFTYDSAAVEFRPGKYAFTTLSSVAELRQGESTVLVFELHNQNSYGSTEFAIHVEPTPDFFVAIQPSHALLEAGDSIQISIQVFANSLPGISTDIRVMAYDGCTTVTGTHTLAIVPLDFVVMYAEGDICATSNMTTSILPSACKCIYYITVNMTENLWRFGDCQCPHTAQSLTCHTIHIPSHCSTSQHTVFSHTSISPYNLISTTCIAHSILLTSHSPATTCNCSFNSCQFQAYGSCIL